MTPLGGRASKPPDNPTSPQSTDAMADPIVIQPQPATPPPAAPPPVDPLAPVVAPAQPSLAGRVFAALVFAAIVGVVVHAVYWHWPARPAHHAGGARAAITVDGGDVPARVAPHAMLVFTADKAVARTVMWSVDPPSTSYKIAGGELIVAAGPGGRVITVRQVAVKSDTADEAEASIQVGDAPAPPGPDAPDVPEPAAGTFDPAVRAAAAAYFANYVAAYGSVPALLDAGDPTYNDVTQGLVDRKSGVGTTLGEAVDAVTKTTYDAQLKYDKARAKPAYTLIANSLLAGLRDAARAAK